MEIGRYLSLLLALLLPSAATAQGASLFASGTAQGPLVALQPRGGAEGGGGSLFVGQDEAGLFAPWPDRPPPPPRAGPGPLTAPFASSGPVGLLRDLIALAEAGSAGYDAVQHGARVPPARRPTQMRIAEIRAWVAATPGQPHAIGRYQFIPGTFDTLVRQLGIPEDALFSVAVQDRMAERLMMQAGLAGFLRGEVGRTAFMNNLAKIWAGLPNSSGKSHYHGYAGNRAVISWTVFEREMRRIFPSAGV